MSGLSPSPSDPLFDTATLSSRDADSRGGFFAQLPAGTGYFAAFVLAGGGMGLKLLAEGWCGEVFPAYASLLPVVVLVALLVGGGPGLLATGLVMVCNTWPVDGPRTAEAGWGGLVLFAGAGLSISLAGECLRRMASQRQRGRAFQVVEARYRAFIETTSQGVVRVDPMGTIVSVNPQMCLMIGHPAGELLGRSIFSHCFPEDLSSARELFQRAVNGEKLQVEFRLRRGDSSELWTSISTSPLRDSGGRLDAVLGMVADITDRKRAERSLAAEREILQRTFDFLPVMLLIWDPHLQQFTLNRHTEQVLGWCTADANDGDFLAKVYPEPVYRAEVVSFMQSLEVGWRKFNVTTSDGRTVPVDWANIRLSDDRMIGIGVDLRDRKRAEAALQESEERYRGLLGVLPTAMYSCDSNGLLTFFNEQAVAIWGRSPRLGDPGDRFCGAFQLWNADGTPLAHADCPMAVAVREGKSFRGVEAVMERPDGARVNVSVNIDPLRDSGGRISGAINVFTDITARKRDEQALRELNETLEARVAERTAEVQRQSDQLRALTAELTQAEQRERRRLATVLHDHIQQILAAALLQLHSIGAHVASERAREQLEWVRQILGESIEACRSLTVDLSPPVLYEQGLGPALEWLARRMAKDFQFTVKVQAETGSGPRDENTRIVLFQAVRELVFNAYKHSGVACANVTLEGTKDGSFELSVSDDGRGFELPQTGEKGKFGLFSIEQRLAFLGGKMRIEAENGRGTRITLNVPAETPQAVSPQSEQVEAVPVSVPGSSGIRVVIADDHAILRDGVSQILRSQADIEVLAEAADGEEAVALVAKLQPELVLMDVSMPRMDGIEATRRITTRFPHIKVIGLSMFEAEEVQEPMRQAGAVAYVNKAGAAEELLRVIRAVVAGPDLDAAVA